MPFDLNHWTRPRETIATRYRDDDLAYATHGAMLAMEVIRVLDLKPSEAGKLKLLDYGCGTGRVARVLSGYFGSVVGYDPVKECIQEGVKEARGGIFAGLTMVDRFVDLNPKSFDAIISINVMEHLDTADQKLMLGNIDSMAKTGARLVLWYSMVTNVSVLANRFGDDIVADDTQFMAANPGSRIRVRGFNL